MTEIPKVSVIMPVYGVEKYVARAIESILQQTFRDFEFLIVDDGSRDESGKICDRYAEQDTRINVFHIENSGAPAARNYALDRANGKFVYFMDGDDWAEPEMLTEMVQLAEANSAQLVIAGFYIDTFYKGTNFFTEKKSVPSQIFHSANAFRYNAHQLFDQNLLYTPWNKLFLRDYLELHKIRFKPTFWDDFPFVLDVIRDVQTVVITQDAYYHFIRARSDSETTRYRSGVFEKRIEEDCWMQELYAHWRIGHLASQEMISRRFIERIFGCIENILAPESTLTNEQKYQLIANIVNLPRTRECLKTACAKSFYSKLMWLPLRWKNVPLLIAEGKFISLIKRHNLLLFAYLKSNR